MRRYEVVADLQGGSFGMGKQYTAEEWAEQACDWLEADGCSTVEEVRAYWLSEIAEGREEVVISTIAELWQLDIQEVKEDK